MHDPHTVAFTIKYPWTSRVGIDGKPWHDTFITIWHVDPQTDGTDDSCGWFKRARHGDPEVLSKIKNSFDNFWDGEFDGLFDKTGRPKFSPMSVTLQMFCCAAYIHFGQDHRKAKRFMDRNLYEIIYFAENATDSMYNAIVGTYGFGKRDDRIGNAASVVYGYILRADQKWWQHPRWHFWHWQVKIEPLSKLWRYLTRRCSKCGRGFRWDEYPISDGSGKRHWHAKCDPSFKPKPSVKETADENS